MQPGYVQIIHPELGADAISEVPEGALAEWFASGWRRLADDEAPAAEAQGEPPPMTRAQAAKARRAPAESGATEEK